MAKMPSPKDLSLIYALSFMDLFAVGLTVPLMANHFRDLGASHFTVGLISSLYSVLQTMTAPLIGSWSDIKDRKSVLVVTLTVCSLCYPLLGLTSSLFTIMVLRSVLGTSKHTQTLCKALITDLLPPEERAGAFGRSTAYGSIGFIVGPILGGHVSEWPNGFAVVCAITGALFVANIGLSLQLSHGGPPQPPIRRQQMGVWSQFRADLTRSVEDFRYQNWRALWESLLLRFLFGLSVTLYFSQQSVYLKEQFQLSQRHIGYAISYFSAVGTATAFWMHHITKWFYKDDVTCLARLVHFYLIMSVSYVGLYAAPSVETLLVLLAPFSISCTMLRIVTMERLLKNSMVHQRGSLSGSANSVMSVARFVAPVTSGLVGDSFGEHSTMLVAALPAVVGTAVCLRLKRASKVRTH